MMLFTIIKKINGRKMTLKDNSDNTSSLELSEGLYISLHISNSDNSA